MSDITLALWQVENVLLEIRKLPHTIIGTVDNLCRISKYCHPELKPVITIVKTVCLNTKSGSCMSHIIFRYFYSSVV
jgi:hypothetical protein